MAQVVVRVEPNKVKERTVLYRHSDGRIAIVDPKRTEAMSESTIIRECTLSRTTEKWGSWVSLFYVGPVVWPDGDLGETFGVKAIEDALNGFNVSILGYGETRSDKTSSLFGVQNAPSAAEAAGGELGLSNKICSALLHARGSVVSSIGVSFIEIHNGSVRSLLRGGACGLRARQDGDLDSLETVKIESLDHFQKLIVDGLLERQESSKGHTLLSIKVEAADGRITRVNMVDLAGSESKGSVRESFQVLDDLSNLRDVLMGIYRTSTAIPFEKSVLTSLLKDSLSVRARTTVLVTVSPSPSNYKESTFTLEYAQMLHLHANGDRTDEKVFHPVPSETRKPCDKAVKALVKKLDRLPKERQHPDNPFIRRNVRGAVLEEAEDEKSRSHLEEEKEDSPGEALVEEHVKDHGDGVNVLGKGVGRETIQAQEEERNEYKGFRMLIGEVKYKDWVTEKDLDGFKRERMAWARRRNLWKGRDDRNFIMGRSAAGLEENAENRTGDLSSDIREKKEEKVQRRTQNGRDVVIDRLEAKIAALETQLTQQRVVFANHIAEERELRLKEREEDEARAHAMEARVERLEGLIANRAQHRLQAHPELHREEVEAPRTAHGPRYMQILWGFSVALGAFGLLIVVLMIYLKVTYGPLVI